MTTGDHILYRTASRQRKRRGTVTETLSGWKYVKVLKNKLTSWIAKADVVTVLPKEPVQPMKTKQTRLL